MPYSQKRMDRVCQGFEEMTMYPEEEATNFVSEDKFRLLLESLDEKETEATFNGLSKMSKLDWKMLFRTMYGSALRITEVTTLLPQDFDLEHRILTLRNTKTGFKKKKGHKVRVVQRTTILGRDIEDMKDYLSNKVVNMPVFPVSRQMIHKKFKQMCKDSGQHFFWQKEERSFKDNPYLLRSSRAKIMEQKGAEYSLIALKLRHKNQMVTMRYTAVDIHALLNWEILNYPTLRMNKK